MASEFGELLRHARAYKGVTLREAERATRISRHYLVALEREEFAELPALTYARGIVRKYAEYLGLDPVTVLAKFEDIHGQRSGGFRVVPAVKPLDVPSHWAPNFAIIAFMVVMSAVIFAWMYSAYFAPADSISTPTPSTSVGVAQVSETPEAQFAEGGGDSTATAVTSETPEPTATAPATSTAAAVVPTPTPTVAPTATPTPTPPPTPTPTPANTTHTFGVTTTARVWVEVTVDGQIVLAEIVEAGTSRTFEGKEMHVVSGNAAFVNVSVDGVDQGVLGDTWDAEKTYGTTASQ